MAMKILDLSKREFFTIALLSITFFSIAIWNLGFVQTPTSSWKTNETRSFLIDLSEPASLSTVYLLVKNGSTNVQVYTGSPNNWSSSSSLNISGSYYSWNKINIDSSTRYLRFYFEPLPSIEIAEVALQSSGSDRIESIAVSGENKPDLDLSNMFDEQNLVQLPPTYMSETIFDEIYFVRTAEEYMKTQYPFEWTHPPLGKLIIALGIAVFGYSPFAWRIMGVIFATLMIPVIFILGKKLFGTWIGAFAPAFLLTFDFMHFTMGRMATTDTYVVFFSLVSQLFFLVYLKNVLKNGWKTSITPLFFAFLFFALGFSTKWLVVYGFAAQLAILAFLRLKETLKQNGTLLTKINAFLDHPSQFIVGFLLVAIIVYFLTYIPDLLAGRTLTEVFGLQGAMYNYHSTLNATHPFSSPWWAWPPMLKPVWLYVSFLPSNMKSTITLLGNPAVWWAGFAFIFLAVAQAVRKKDLACAFIASFFFVQWIPYILISRITFLYHFYPNVPILCLAPAYFLSKYWNKKWVKIAAVSYFLCVVVIFGLFYTVISGIPASISWIDSLKWLNGWNF